MSVHLGKLIHNRYSIKMCTDKCPKSQWTFSIRANWRWRLCLEANAGQNSLGPVQELFSDTEVQQGLTATCRADEGGGRSWKGLLTSHTLSSYPKVGGSRHHRRGHSVCECKTHGREMDQGVPENFEPWRLELVGRDSHLLLMSAVLIVVFSVYQHWFSASSFCSSRHQRTLRSRYCD